MAQNASPKLFTSSISTHCGRQPCASRSYRNLLKKIHAILPANGDSHITESFRLEPCLRIAEIIL